MNEYYLLTRLYADGSRSTWSSDSRWRTGRDSARRYQSLSGLYEDLLLSPKAELMDAAWLYGTNEILHVKEILEETTTLTPPSKAPFVTRVVLCNNAGEYVSGTRVPTSQLEKAIAFFSIHDAMLFLASNFRWPHAWNILPVTVTQETKLIERVVR